jgi:hypothetical protein
VSPSHIPAAAVREQVSRLESLPLELTLGSLCWYSLSSSLHLEHQEFLARVAASGLDVTTVPLFPDGADVYRRAIKENALYRVTNPDDSVSSYMIRPWVMDDHAIIHQIVCEKNASRTTSQLRYIVLGNIVYDRQTEQISLQFVGDPVFEQVAQQLHESVRDYFSYWRGYLPDQPIRAMIRRFLDRWNATAVRPSGGIYFVSNIEHDNLLHLESLINGLPGNQASFHVLPLIDDRKQREMLKKAFEDESIGEVDKLLGDIHTILADPEKKISFSALEKFQERFLFLTGKTSHYSDLLTENMELTNARLEILQASIRGLFERVRES